MAEDVLTLTMDRSSVIIISIALKNYSDDLWVGSQAGRIQKAHTDSIRDYLDEALKSGLNLNKNERR